MAPTKSFTTKDIPSLPGKIILITGATGGLGFATALALAPSGARILVGGRNAGKGKEAVDKIKAAVPSANVSFAMIDHGSLASIEAYTNEYNAKGQPLDILINNAGVMATPTRSTTSDDFELQFATNHLAHFALTAQLLPSLRRSSYPARVVNVSSIAARQGKICLEDLNYVKNYDPWTAYRQSKLANILFSRELQRRSDEGSWGIMALSAHPGVSKTELVANGPGGGTWTGRAINFIGNFISQEASKGALPQLYAAVSPDVEKNGYYGPNGMLEMKGEVADAGVPCLAKDVELGKKLWEESVKMTKVNWPN